MPEISASECDTAVRRLQDLIRIDTTNPPGNERAACDYLAAVLTGAGIPFQILESAPGRANLVARLKGDGSLPPLLLTSHLDVVPAERERWRCQPFAADLRDGCVWGRGAVDMKNMTVMELAIFLKAQHERLSLKRDLILVAVADEEAGCEHGSKFLVDKHPDLIRAEYALGEVGGFSLTVDGTVFYPIGVAEKGVCWFKLTATGKPGHGAMPHDHQALSQVCLAAHRLAENKLPFHNAAVVNDFIAALAARQKFPKNLILKNTRRRTLSDFILNRLFPDKSRARGFKNMFRNLATPTVIRGGDKINVIPSETALWVDGRILPGQTIAGFLDEVKALIGDGLKIEVMRAEEAGQTEYPTPLYDALKESLKRHDPGCVPVPFLIPGYTDAKHYARLGIKCYGFIPLKLPADLNFGELYHGHDERIPTAALHFGLEVLWDVVRTTCAAKQGNSLNPSPSPGPKIPPPAVGF